MASAPRVWRGALVGALIVAIGAISCAAIFFRLASGVHPLVASAWRLTLSALCFVPWVVWRSQRVGTPMLPLRRWWRAGVGAGAAYAVHFGAWVWSLGLTSVAASVTLVTVTPLMLAGVAWVTGKDRPRGEVMGAFAVAAAGVVLLSVGSEGGARAAGAPTGEVLALVGAAAMAAYLVWVKPVVEQGVDVGALSLVACAVGAALLWGASVVAGVPLGVEGGAFVYLLASALVPQVVGHSVLTWSLRRVTPTMAGVATLGEPVGATLLGVWLLGEQIGVREGVGCALTLVGVAAALRFGTSRARLAGSTITPSSRE